MMEERQNATTARSSRRLAGWPRVWLPTVAVAVASIGLAGVIGVVAGGSLSVSFWALAILGVPAVTCAAVLTALNTLGAGPAWRCGHCGYDLRSAPGTGVCPECGLRGDDPLAPGHRPLGQRRLPVWIWLPTCGVLPAGGVMISGLVGGPSGWHCVGTLAVLVALLIAGLVHAWRQARP